MKEFKLHTIRINISFKILDVWFLTRVLDESQPSHAAQEPADEEYWNQHKLQESDLAALAAHLELVAARHVIRRRKTEPTDAC